VYIPYHDVQASSRGL